MKVPDYSDLRTRVVAAYQATNNEQLKQLLLDIGAAVKDLFYIGKKAQMEIRRLNTRINKLERELKKRK